MVRLTKIYTKTGDKGDTGLGDGSRVAKHDLRVEAYGTVDEANAVIGLARLHVDDELDVILARIQNDLFDVGADLCTPIVENPKYPPLRLAEGKTVEL
ncbi:MAG: ATP:cob(I)alamin adenosyltransferase, partial [Marinobacter sp.]